MINTTQHPGSDVPITLEQADAEHVRLTLGDDVFTLRPDELPGGLHQAHEIQRRRMAALEDHEPWCDQAAHARNGHAFLEPVPECQGHDHPITLSGQEWGGYWTQRSDGSTVLFTEWPGGVMAELTVDEVRRAYRVALHFGGSRDVEQVTTMLGDALDEYHGGDGWRGPEL